jgi:dTDP-4-amino-4,6-dideoxygalactose transaminase
LGPLYVTKSLLPPLKLYSRYLKKIWENGILTNDGPLVRDFEQKLKKLTASRNVICVSNGTIAIQLALRSLHIKGEVITTPFSFIATTSSILWEGSKPVYADIDPNTLNIDPDCIRKKITKKTKAILAVHVYGNPCDVDEIQAIAKKYKLKVIYDACHAIGINYKGKSIYRYGDISTTSFHATKIINTAEGGALFTSDNKTAETLRLQRNFGYKDYVIHMLGINGKLNEFNAALGLANLQYLNYALKKRKDAFELYNTYFKNNKQMSYQSFQAKQNYAYYPVIFKSEKLKKSVIKELNKNNIYPREYFSPSLELVFGKKITCPVADDISKRILCLPLSAYSTKNEVAAVSKIVNKVCGS